MSDNTQISQSFDDNIKQLIIDLNAEFGLVMPKNIDPTEKDLWEVLFRLLRQMGMYGFMDKQMLSQIPEYVASKQDISLETLIKNISLDLQERITILEIALKMNGVEDTKIEYKLSPKIDFDSAEMEQYKKDIIKITESLPPSVQKEFVDYATIGYEGPLEEDEYIMDFGERIRRAIETGDADYRIYRDPLEILRSVDRSKLTALDIRNNTLSALTPEQVAAIVDDTVDDTVDNQRPNNQPKMERQVDNSGLKEILNMNAVLNPDNRSGIKTATKPNPNLTNVNNQNIRPNPNPSLNQNGNFNNQKPPVLTINPQNPTNLGSNNPNLTNNNPRPNPNQNIRPNPNSQNPSRQVVNNQFNQNNPVGIKTVINPNLTNNNQNIRPNLSLNQSQSNRPNPNLTNVNNQKPPVLTTNPQNPVNLGSDNPRPNLTTTNQNARTNPNPRPPVLTTNPSPQNPLPKAGVLPRSDASIPRSPFLPSGKRKVGLSELIHPQDSQNNNQ